MSLAEIGPLTDAMEALASAVGAGGLLGAFLMGAFGFFAGWPRQGLEARALTDGYAGGFIATQIVLTDMAVRYLS
ncbi:MAG TPA: hypothetical protein VGO66_01560 [Solirubrobacterales bacterium]|jgi:hypothetical protein|nr:hypothetical protein [Solirubrobacterales bacterium]